MLRKVLLCITCTISTMILFPTPVFAEENYDWYAEGMEILEEQEQTEQMETIAEEVLLSESETIDITETVIEKAPLVMEVIPEKEPEIIKEQEPIQRATPLVDVTSNELLYRVVEAEAGIEPYECKQLVASVVLNRVSSPSFPNNINDVIYADNQFATVRKLHKVVPSEETKRAVDEVLMGINRDYNAMYFRNEHYFSWVKPYKNISNTYFSYSRDYSGDNAND